MSGRATLLRRLILPVIIPLYLVIPASASDASANLNDEVALLRERLSRQQLQIDELQAAVASQRRLLDELVSRKAASEVTSAPSAAAQPLPSSAAALAPVTPVASQESKQGSPTVSIAELAKKAESTVRGLGGFQFSGDFPIRADMQFRHANALSGPVQQLRGRYRMRFNIDKEIDPKLRFHLQLATGQFNNANSTNQDFGAMIAHAPISISGVYLDYHPTPNISFRGGRLENVFSDNMRFHFADDVRFNGVHQTARIPFGKNALGLTSVEFRSGEYILSHPNVTVLSASSPFVNAGYKPGQKVRDAMLIHPGFIIRGDLGNRWSQRIQGDMAIFRDANQIQLASTSAGFPVVMSNTVGFALWAPLTGGGNATTTPGGAILNAGHYQIAHVSYRLERKAVLIANHEMPLLFDIQLSRNVGAGKLRDAITASAGLGQVKKAGDLSFLYQWGIKDANSMFGQFTDDCWGTNTGVNFAAHAIRVDLGLSRHLQFQNLLFIQNQRRASNPAENFYVTIPRGANTLFRFISQFSVNF